MAETKTRFIKWVIDWTTGVLKATFKLALSEVVETFDLKVIFPTWESFNEIQKHAILTGIKPKLEDCTAAEAAKKLTAHERRKLVTDMWKQLTEQKLWSRKAEPGDRVSISKLNTKLAELPKESLANLPDDVKAALRESGITI